jgi:hypothetical protein
VFVTTEEKEKKGTPEVPKLNKDWTNVKCFHCKKKGHPVKFCPEKETERKEAERKTAEASVHLVWANANVMMTTFSVMNATDEKLAVSQDEVLLDTQAKIMFVPPVNVTEGGRKWIND